MNYWLTIHGPDDPLETGVWVRDGKESVLGDMRADDLVFIYETRSGKTFVEQRADGSQHKVPRRKGRQGVVALVTVTSAPAEVEHSQPKEYSDGSSIWWRYRAKASCINTGGFIGRAALARILEYSEKYSFYGFGDQNSGVKRLLPDQFEAVRTAFLRAHTSIATLLKEERGISRRGGGTGEGPDHKALKEYIARDPARALGEEGIRTLEIEYTFPTGDRVDLILLDQNGRAVTVEVEVDCGEKELAGPLQCMKYRALLAYLLRRPVSEIRTLLAARSVVASIRERCEDYEIEVVEVDTWSAT